VEGVKDWALLLVPPAIIVIAAALAVNWTVW
jgi:hypothetical protein